MSQFSDYFAGAYAMPCGWDWKWLKGCISLIFLSRDENWENPWILTVSLTLLVNSRNQVNKSSQGNIINMD